MNAQTHTWKQSFSHALQSAWIRTIVLVAILIGLMVPGAVLAYGPERETYTLADPADHITFNSIVDNAGYGDERNFVRIKDAADTSNSNWTDDMTVQDDKEYLVKVYVHNNAAANLNLVAQNTRVLAYVPTTIGKDLQVDGYISADNASPQKVWDSVRLNSDKDFVAQYVAGSARYFNNIQSVNGFALPDSIVTTTGAQLGYESMNGQIPGCFQYAGFVTYKIKVETENISSFAVEKKVRVNGATTWSSEAISVQPGQKIDYQIGYTNTGEVTHDNVIVKDQIPSLVTYVAGSTTLKNTNNPNGNGASVSSNGVVSGGINIGSYAAGSNAYVRFTATAPTNDQLPKCGENILRNTAFVEIGGYGRQDAVDIKINKTCAPSAPGTSETPTSLPQTGPVEVVTILVVVTVAAVVASHYVHRRRALHNYESALTTSEHQLLLPKGPVTGDHSDVEVHYRDYQ